MRHIDPYSRSWWYPGNESDPVRGRLMPGCLGGSNSQLDFGTGPIQLYLKLE